MPGARLFARLGDQCSQRDPGDDPVAAGEKSSVGARAERIFADQRAAAVEDLRSQALVFRGIYTVEAAGHHGDGSASSLERGLVRDAIHASGEPGNDGQTGVGEFGREGSRDLDSIRRGTARADDGQRPLVAVQQLAANVQQGRGVGDLPKPTWISVVIRSQRGDAGVHHALIGLMRVERGPGGFQLFDGALIKARLLQGGAIRAPGLIEAFKKRSSAFSRAGPMPATCENAAR